MPTVEPFQGVRYDTAVAGSIDTVIAPPYDKVTDENHPSLLSRSTHNAVRLELPVEDGEANWQTRAATDLQNWLMEGVLLRESAPAFYAYEQEFNRNGQSYTRWGFMGLFYVGVEDYKDVRPHEQTFPRIKAERLELMRQSRANLSPIFMMYDDPQNNVKQALVGGNGELIYSAVDDDGTVHRIRKVDDLEAIKSAHQSMKNAATVIADGHHRFETAQTFAREMRDANPAEGPGAPFNYVMTYFTPAQDAGMLILPAHRAMQFPAGTTQDDLDRLVEANWDREEKADPEAVAQAIDRARCDELVVGVVAANQCAVLRPRAEAYQQALPEGTSDAKRQLPVVALHTLLIDPLLNGEPLKQYVSFYRDATAAVGRVQAGECDAAFLWPAVTPEQVLAVVETGERMPQKSTDFYPKVATGLLFNVF